MTWWTRKSATQPPDGLDRRQGGARPRGIDERCAYHQETIDALRAEGLSALRPSGATVVGVAEVSDGSSLSVAAAARRRWWRSPRTPGPAWSIRTRNLVLLDDLRRPRSSSSAARRSAETSAAVFTVEVTAAPPRRLEAQPPPGARSSSVAHDVAEAPGQAAGSWWRVRARAPAGSTQPPRSGRVNSSALVGPWLRQSLRASGDTSAILGDPYADISTRTMLPAAHLLWSLHSLGEQALNLSHLTKLCHPRAVW